jgi:hypothetical protein
LQWRWRDASHTSISSRRHVACQHSRSHTPSLLLNRFNRLVVKNEASHLICPRWRSNRIAVAISKKSSLNRASLDGV